MFEIHKQLLNDCHHLGVLNNCHCLLHKNAALHWFILVPITECKNLLELDESMLNESMQTAQTVNHYLTQSLGYKKTNFASIGNMVDQLHLHVVGRSTTDVCWPQPVWGNLKQQDNYSVEAIERIKKELIHQCR